MRTPYDIPIRQKLIIITMVTTTMALLLAGTGIVIADQILFRRFLENDLAAAARIIGDNSTAALAFNDAKAASETLGDLRARPHMITACLYHPDGTILARYARQATSIPCPVPQRADETLFGDMGIAVSHPIFLSGKRVGTLVLLYDIDAISERTRLYSATVLGVLLFSSFVAFLLSSRLRALIATPIAQLVNTTRAVSETSDYSIRAQKFSGDELGVLVDRFNEMLAGIESRDRNLRTALHQREEALHEAEEARERFRFMAESMPQKIFTAKPSGEIDYFNRQWMEFTGLSFEQIRDWWWMQFVHPDDLEGNVQTWRHSIETGEPFLFQHRFRRADGAYRWHLSRAHAMRDAEGKISMWIGSNTEFQEQKETEEELRRANTDLQQFAYSASHDLQEPIRNVAVYSEIVAKRYRDILDAEGQLFRGFLTEGARRLARLVSDLLAYTKAGVVEGTVAAVDATIVLDHVIASLSEAIHESDATVTWDALPLVCIAEAHLHQILQNLVGNAIKYRGQDPPRIHVSAVYQGAAWCFSIQDNGIGIDPKYKERIFGIFKRLHHDDKYGGTGIGLAICQRVVERYGGRIWVESVPGKGSTFFFTIPEKAPRTQTAAAESAASRR